MEWTLITSFLSGILGSALFQTYIRGGINNFYNKKLESFKSDLTIETETRKFEFDKKIHDFSIYSSRRHELYPDLYSQIREIDLSFLMMREKSIISAEYIINLENIIRYYENVDIRISDRQKDKIRGILELEYTDREECIKEVENSMYQYLIHSELEKIRSLNSFVNKMELYCSEKISGILNSLLSNMLYIITIELGAIMQDSELGTTDNKIIIEETEKIKKQLKIEMSLGY